MRTAQLTAWQPPAVLYTTTSGLSRHSQPLKPSNLSYPLGKNINLSLKTTSSSSIPLLRSRRSSIVCLSNSNSTADSEGSLWKAFGKALGNVTGGRSIEDVLKQQMQKKEFHPDRGGSSGGPPRGGGGGGGGGSSDGSDGIEEESFWDELLQKFLATIGIVSLYIYLIKGEELIRLAKDYRIYLTTGEESYRVESVREKWRDIREAFTPKPIRKDDPFWLESVIMSTKTQYDSPEKYRRIAETYKKQMPQGSEPRTLDSFLEDSDDESDDDNDGI